MKRLGNLYDKIISMDNLRLADERARKGKTHSYGVRVHDKHAEADLLALHEALKADIRTKRTYYLPSSILSRPQTLIAA